MTSSGSTPRRVVLSSNMEDYVEVIYRLTGEEGSCRVNAIAECLSFKPPSISRALKRLGEMGLVNHSPYGEVTLTELGQRIGKRQTRIHQTIHSFLVDVLHLSPDLAEHDTCHLEHAVSPETIDRLIEFLDYLSSKEGLKNPFPEPEPPVNPKEMPRGFVRKWKSNV